jgi:hypothetical protein
MGKNRVGRSFGHAQREEKEGWCVMLHGEDAYETAGVQGRSPAQKKCDLIRLKRIVMGWVFFWPKTFNDGSLISQNDRRAGTPMGRFGLR